MFFHTAEGFEIGYLSHLDLCMFIDNIEVSTIKEWRKFAKQEIGYDTIEPVASYLRKTNRLSDTDELIGWATLSDLLVKFNTYLYSIYK